MKFAVHRIITGITLVAPARERGLKYDVVKDCIIGCVVAPARERGLKSRVDSGKNRRVAVAPARERGLK